MEEVSSGTIAKLYKKPYQPGKEKTPRNTGKLVEKMLLNAEIIGAYFISIVFLF